MIPMNNSIFALFIINVVFCFMFTTLEISTSGSLLHYTLSALISLLDYDNGILALGLNYLLVLFEQVIQ